MAKDQLHDLVIIGGGPAGLSAAIYAQRALLDAVLLEKQAVGGQVVTTADIDNYPGVPHTDGFTLIDAMERQAKDLGATISLDTVESLSHDDANNCFVIETSACQLCARTVIACGGATPRPAGFDGEDTFAGRGVSYCATCDGMFYRGKTVYVVGGGNSAGEEAMFLTRFAEQVIVVVRKDHMRAQASVVKELEEHPKVTIKYQTQVVRVEGDGLLSSVTLRDTASGEERTETYDAGGFGVFVFVGHKPASELLDGLVEFDESGYVMTDERMATKTAGLFVAGDIRHKPLRQIVTAAADGAIAATSVSAYLGHPVEG